MSSGSSKKSGSSSKDKGKDSAKKAASDAKELRKQLEKKAEKLAAKAADGAKKAEKKAKKKAAEKAEEDRKALKKAEKKAEKKAGKKAAKDAEKEPTGASDKKSGKKRPDSGRRGETAEVLLSPATETALVTPITLGRDVTPTSKSDLPSTVPVIVEAELSPATAPKVRAAAEAAMKPSEAWTVVALRARARQLGLVGYSSLSKTQLLERLRD